MKKRCFKCGTEKNRGEFYAHPEMGDGLLGKCKECTKADVRLNRSRHLDYYRSYDRNRFQVSVDRREQAERSQRTGRHRHREKFIARGHVSRALRTGKISKRPCEVCGTRLKIQAHHPDYSQPLSVRWLCVEHHFEQHRRYA